MQFNKLNFFKQNPIQRNYFWGAIIILALLFITPVILAQVSRMRALAVLFQCDGTSLSTLENAQIWIKTPERQTGSGCTAPLERTSSEGDITAVANWMQGRKVDSPVLEKISPAWRKELFQLRNQNWQITDRSTLRDIDPKVTEFMSQVAILAWNSGDLDRAQVIVRTALQIQPGIKVLSTLLSGIGTFTPNESNIFESLIHFSLQINPDDLSMYSFWFKTMLNQRLYPQAEQACLALRSHTSSSNNGTTASCLAQVAFLQKDYSRAYQDLLPTTTQGTNEWEVWLWFGLSARQLIRCEEAVTALNRALQEGVPSSHLTNLYWNLGDCQEILGKKQAAIDSYQSAIRYTDNSVYRNRLTDLIEQLK